MTETDSSKRCAASVGREDVADDDVVVSKNSLVVRRADADMMGMCEIGKASNNPY